MYVTDVYCGASLDSRKSIRFITEVAWQAHFIQNMFIVPQTQDELDNFKPDFTIYNSCKTVDMAYASHGLHSEVYVIFNVEENTAIIGGTWYAGEMKKRCILYDELLASIRRKTSYALFCKYWKMVIQHYFRTFWNWKNYIIN